MTVAGKSTAGQEGADSGIRYRYPGRADHPAGQALEDREREECRTGPLQRAHPQPPPPRFPNASRHPLGGVDSDNMIPAPVRSVPQERTGGVYGYLPVCNGTVTRQSPCGGAASPCGSAVSG